MALLHQVIIHVATELTAIGEIRLFTPEIRESISSYPVKLSENDHTQIRPGAIM